jgi:hypothetical protein
MTKVQIVVTAETFEQACGALASLGGDTDGRRLQGLLESCCAVSIDEDRGVWLQQALVEEQDDS